MIEYFHCSFSPSNDHERSFDNGRELFMFAHLNGFYPINVCQVSASELRIKFLSIYFDQHGKPFTADAYMTFEVTQ